MSGEFNTLTLLLQGSACLALGLISSTLWARRPARAHQILLMGLIACVFLPGLYLAVQVLELGLLQGPCPSEPIAVVEEPFQEKLPPMTTMEPSIAWEPLPESTAPLTETPLLRIPSDTQAVHPIAWDRIALLLWGLMSLLILTRLIIQYGIALRLLRQSRKVTAPSLIAALELARQRIEIKRPARLRSCPAIQSPMIWCWGRTPILLVQPVASSDQGTCDWVGMFRA